MKVKPILSSLILGLAWALIHIAANFILPWNMYLFFLIMAIALILIGRQSMLLKKQSYSNIRIIGYALLASYFYLICFVPYYFYTMKIQEIGKNLPIEFYWQNFRNGLIFFTIVTSIASGIGIFIGRKNRDDKQDLNPANYSEDTLN